MAGKLELQVPILDPQCRQRQVRNQSGTLLTKLLIENPCSIGVSSVAKILFAADRRSV
jgi:hypothetical protein